MTSNIPVFPPPHTDLQCRVLCLFDSGFLFSYLTDIYRASVPGGKMNLTLFSWLVFRKGRKNEFLHLVIHVTFHIKAASDPQVPRNPTLCGPWKQSGWTACHLSQFHILAQPGTSRLLRPIPLGPAQLGGPAAHSLVTREKSSAGWVMKTMGLSRDALEPMLSLITRPIHGDFLKSEIVPALLKNREAKGRLS